MRLALPRPPETYNTRDQSETRRSIEAELSALREQILQVTQEIAALKARLAAASIP